MPRDWDSMWNAWQDDNAQACAAAVEAMRAAGDPASLGLHLRRYAFVQSLQSRYRAACRAAEEGKQLAIDAGDSFDYLLCQFFWAWALFYAGRWRRRAQAMPLVARGRRWRPRSTSAASLPPSSSTLRLRPRAQPRHLRPGPRAAR